MTAQAPMAKINNRLKPWENRGFGPVLDGFDPVMTAYFVAERRGVVYPYLPVRVYR
jgi:hypothetical protein